MLRTWLEFLNSGKERKTINKEKAKENNLNFSTLLRVVVLNTIINYNLKKIVQVLRCKVIAINYQQFMAKYIRHMYVVVSLRCFTRTKDELHSQQHLGILKIPNGGWYRQPIVEYFHDVWIDSLRNKKRFLNAFCMSSWVLISFSFCSSCSLDSAS